MTWYIKSLQAEVCLCSPVHCLAPLHLHWLAFRPCQALHQLQHLLRSMSATAADVERTLTLPTSPRLILLDGELTLRIIQLLMAYFDERRDALILLADMSATAADVERTLTLPTSPRLILLVAGDKVTIKRWMISMEGDVICEGVQPSFISGLAALLATYYVFNLEYHEEGARTLEFVQRRFIGVNPERGTKASQGKVVSKKTGKLVQKKAATVNPHVAILIKNLTDFEWGFM
ncbi:uncharacterized protein LOC133657419 [Entelurus aequoreus]|uniref:uncharacterized protein LOC133657419 n=1 Tax=Entelurus aequoreus TaxID=161455 RepID=UPI002B1E0935|nr:uncharacterized protein LOC133657419 [Entelurus aequoreus]